jgi:hypothetical protein
MLTVSLLVLHALHSLARIRENHLELKWRL